MQHTNAIIQLVVGGLMLFQFFKIKEKNKICFVIKKDPRFIVKSQSFQVHRGANLHWYRFSFGSKEPNTFAKLLHYKQVLLKLNF